MSEPPDRPPQRRGIAFPVRPVALILMAAMSAAVFALLHPVPAEAHIAGAGGSPTDYRAAVTSISPAAPAVGVTVGLGGQWVRVTNRDAAQVVVLGRQGEPFLRLAGDQVQVNELSTTAVDSGLVQPTAPPSAPATGPKWVPKTGGDRISWTDPRITPGPGTGRSATWELPLIVDGQQVSVLGTVQRVPAPSPWPWVAALVSLTAAVSALGWVRNWRGPMVAVVTLGILAFTLHLLGTGFTPQENGALYAWIGIGAVGAFALLIGLVTVLSTVRGRTSAPERVITTGIMVLILAATDITVLWNSQLPFAGPAALDRALTVLTYGTALGMLVAGVRLSRLARQAAETTAPGTATS